MINEFDPTNSIMSIMVCVTNQNSCDKLIARGMAHVARIGTEKTKLHVVHCVHTGHNFMGASFEGDAIEYLFTAAQLAGADLTLLRAPSVEDALVEYAEKNNIRKMILGAGGPGGREGLVSRLQRRLDGAVEFDVIG